MNRFTLIFSALILILAAAAQGLHAQETGYISDVFRVPVRSGAGNQYRILHAGLPSGTQLQIMETEEDWTRVVTENGLDGWLPSQYVTTQPTARIRLNQVEQRLSRTLEENKQLREQAQRLERENAQLQAQLQQLEQTTDATTEELEEIRALSADAISLNQRHRELLEQHEMLQTTVDTLRAENDRLESDATVNKWLYGAGLVVLGMLLSIIIPALKPKKRYSDWA